MGTIIIDTKKGEVQINAIYIFAPIIILGFFARNLSSLFWAGIIYAITAISFIEKIFQYGKIMGGTNREEQLATFRFEIYILLFFTVGFAIAEIPGIVFVIMSH